jgi:hypothetical protein
MSRKKKLSKILLIIVAFGFGSIALLEIQISRYRVEIESIREKQRTVSGNADLYKDHYYHTLSITRSIEILKRLNTDSLTIDHYNKKVIEGLQYSAFYIKGALTVIEGAGHKYNKTLDTHFEVAEYESYIQRLLNKYISGYNELEISIGEIKKRLYRWEVIRTILMFIFIITQGWAMFLVVNEDI